jgi:hypothetical protein
LAACHSMHSCGAWVVDLISIWAACCHLAPAPPCSRSHLRRSPTS